VSVAGGNAVVIVRASLAQTLLRPPSRRTGRTSSIDAQAWYALRCHKHIAGALRLRDFRPAVVMQTGIAVGNRTPGLSAYQ